MVSWEIPLPVVRNGRSILQRTLEVGNYDTVILDNELVLDYPELIDT